MRLSLCAILLVGCDPAGGPVETGTPVADRTYHPASFSRPEEHGVAMAAFAQDCRSCHGALLDGGPVGVSCDDACHDAEPHPAGWREDCAFCHGGLETGDGAPPRGIARDAPFDPFLAHTAHVTGNRHPAYACETCHGEVPELLAPGHVFDPSPGRAEVDFSRGPSPAAAWDRKGGCSDLYCHGDGSGRTADRRHDEPTPTCSGCHASKPEHLRGAHHEHDDDRCEDCHATVVKGNGTITGAALHVDGIVQVVFEDPLFRMDGDRCTGLCHFEAHFSERW